MTRNGIHGHGNMIPVSLIRSYGQLLLHRASARRGIRCPFYQDGAGGGRPEPPAGDFQKKKGLDPGYNDLLVLDWCDLQGNLLGDLKGHESFYLAGP